MKIAVFIKNTTLHKFFGGLETQNQILCEGLVLRGHTVFVFSPKRELKNSNSEHNGVKYIFVDSDPKARFGFGFLSKNNWLNRSYVEFLKLNKELNFDIIVGQSSGALGLIKHKEELNMPVVSIAHGTITGEFKTLLQNLKSIKSFLKLPFDFGYMLYNFFGRQREYVNHSNHVIAVSNIVKNSLIDETFVPEEKVTVIYNGLNPASIKQKVTNHNKEGIVKFVYVGRVEESKGIGDLIKAFSRVNAKCDCNLTIIGDGPYLEDAKKFSQDLDLTKKVLFPGKMPHDEIAASLCDYDTFVIPSKRYEGFPMTTIEAMLAGLPVIGANIGGVSEAIKENITGKTYKSGNIDELETALLSLATNSNLRQQMGVAGLEFAKENFSLDTMLDKYIKIFEKEIK